MPVPATVLENKIEGSSSGYYLLVMGPELFDDSRLDLWEANRQALLEAGVPAEQIEVAGICTQCQADRYFSHRANGGVPAGRFAGIIRVC